MDSKEFANLGVALMKSVALSDIRSASKLVDNWIETGMVKESNINDVTQLLIIMLEDEAQKMNLVDGSTIAKLAYALGIRIVKEGWGDKADSDGSLTDVLDDLRASLIDRI